MSVLQLDPSVAVDLKNFIPVEVIVALPSLLEVIHDYSRTAENIGDRLSALCEIDFGV